MEHPNTTERRLSNAYDDQIRAVPSAVTGQKRQCDERLEAIGAGGPSQKKRRDAAETNDFYLEWCTLVFCPSQSLIDLLSTPDDIPVPDDIQFSWQVYWYISEFLRTACQLFLSAIINAGP